MSQKKKGSSGNIQACFVSLHNLEFLKQFGYKYFHFHHGKSLSNASTKASSKCLPSVRDNFIFILFQKSFWVESHGFRKKFFVIVTSRNWELNLSTFFDWYATNNSIFDTKSVMLSSRWFHSKCFFDESFQIFHFLDMLVSDVGITT